MEQIIATRVSDTSMRNIGRKGQDPQGAPTTFLLQGTNTASLRCRTCDPIEEQFPRCLYFDPLM